MNHPIIDIVIPESLKKNILQCPSLPSLPGVVLKVIEASKDPDIGLAEVADIIRSDPALSAKIIKTANSPLYSMRRTIHNLREALTLLGLNASLTIALSFSLVKSLKNNPGQSFIHENFWKRSILSATISKHLGAKLGLSNLEDIFLTGLLQDIGILVLQCAHSELYSDTSDQYMHHDQKTLTEHEKLGTNHAIVGAWILQRWKFPEKLYQSVLNSHSLNADPSLHDNNQLFQQCISFSGHLADIWLDDDHQNRLSENMTMTKKILGLDDEAYNEFIAEITDILPEVSSLFEIKLTDNNARDRILEQTKELILERNLQIIKQSEHDRRQIESMEEQAKDLKEETRRDSLTGIYNRKHFEHILDEEFENANLNRWPLSLAFIDIDHFKAVNDSHGHLAGDQVLMRISKFIDQSIRQTDILARYGGDEFILLLPGSTNDVALNMLTRILKNMEEIDFNLESLGSNPTVSIGMASHLDNHDFKNITDLLNAADEALYKAKEAGRDKIVSY